MGRRVQLYSTETILKTKHGFEQFCHTCPLYTKFVRVGGDLKPKQNGELTILVVGEAPGIEEFGSPFQGRPGAFVKAMLNRVGLLEHCSFTNVVKCRPFIVKDTPWGSQYKESVGIPGEALINCIPQMEEETTFVQPDGYVLLGATAFSALAPGNGTITTGRGKIIKINGKPAIGVVHPAIVLRTGSQFTARQIFNDLRRFRKALMGEEDVPKTASVKYSILSGSSDLANFYSRMAQSDTIAVDIESTSLEFSYVNAKILCVAIAVSPTEGFLIPMGHKEAPSLTSLTYEQCLTVLYKTLSRAKRIVFHNGQFDANYIRWEMKKIGLDWSDYSKNHDSMIQHFVLDPMSPHNLQELSENNGWPGSYKDEPHNYLKTLPKADQKWENVPMSILGPYCVYDTCATWELDALQMKEILGNPFLTRAYENVFVPGVQETCHVEYRGIKMDLAKNDELMNRLTEKMNGIHDQIMMNPFVMKGLIEKVGIPVLEQMPVEKLRNFISLTATQQVSNMLFNLIGIPTLGIQENKPKADGTRVWSTNEDTLMKLSKSFRLLAEKMNLFVQGKEENEYPHELIMKQWPPQTNDQTRVIQYEVPHLMTEHRSTSTMYKSFVKPVRSWINEATEIYHPEFKIFGTDTGRLSSGVHTIMKDVDIQSQFISKYGKGGLIVSADYAAIEVRILASFSGDERLIQIFKDGRDIHREVAAFAFQKKFEDVTFSERRYSKTIHFGMIYLQGDESLAEKIRGPGETIEQCLERIREFKKGYYATFPGVPRHIQRMQTQIKEFGVAHCLPYRQEEAVEWYKKSGSINKLLITAFDRLLPCPPETSNWELQVRPVNWPIQSSASDMAWTTACRVNRRFRIEKMEAHVIIMIHDAIYVDCPEDELEDVIHILKEEMEKNVPGWMLCPVEADIEYGPSWGEQKKVGPEKFANKGKRIGANARIAST